MRNRTTISQKGQITIPVEIRRALNWDEGDKLLVEREGGAIRIRPWVSLTDRTAGMLATYRLPVPLTPAQEREFFEQAVADEVADKMARIGRE